MIEIIEYTSQHAPDFKRLNLEWLEKYDLTETHDLIILDDPQGKILDTGGCIYLAKDGDKIIGSAGIINEGNNVFELVKMAVTATHQGKGISKILIEKCLTRAKELNAKKIFLFSNSQLKRAITMYEKYGFVHVDASGSPLLTADVKMELSL